jgi:uncharacterized membrane protein YbhN (UPF0104 family)
MTNISIEEAAPEAGGGGGAEGEGPETVAGGTRRPWISWLVFGVKVGLAAGLLVWLVGSGRLEIGKLTAIPVSGELAIFVGVILLSLVVPAIRWWWLLAIQEIHVPLGRVLSLTWVGYFTTLLLPGATSGDLAKGYLILRGRKDGRTRALSTVLADRAFGLYTLLFLGSLSGLWLAAQGELSGAGLVMAEVGGVVLAAVTAVVLALWYAPTRGLLFWFFPRTLRYTIEQSIDFYVQKKAALAGCFILSLFNSSLTLIALAMAASLLEPTASSWSAAFLVGPMVILANCIPLTPGGLGVGEAVSNSLFTPFGIATGAEIMVMYRVAIAVLSLPGLVVMVMQTTGVRGQGTGVGVQESGARSQGSAAGRAAARAG